MLEHFSTLGAIPHVCKVSIDLREGERERGEKENRPPCCRWGKIYRNHCLIEDICGWNIIQTPIVVSTANPITEICDGKAYARYCLCLHLFPATEFCLKKWLR